MFRDTATVAQANAALQASGATIVGGLPSEGLLLVRVPDGPDFANVEAAWQTLLADSSVEAASLITRPTLNAVPAPPESGIVSTYGWSWETAPTGANWNLEASRVPQAWNLLEAIRRRNGGIGTGVGVIDEGFLVHSDLLRMSIEPLCMTIGGTTSCLARSVSDHGNHVVGIIGASYNNPAGPLQPGRSLGVSGVDPEVAIHAMTWGYGFGFIPQPWEVIDRTLAAKESGAFADLRVINMSWGTPALGGASRYSLAPLLGDYARHFAERAAKLGVTLVAAAGNEPFPAEIQMPFAWAANHWTSSLPNPIIVVEEVNQTL